MARRSANGGGRVPGLVVPGAHSPRTAVGQKTSPERGALSPPVSGGRRGPFCGSLNMCFLSQWESASGLDTAALGHTTHARPAHKPCHGL